MLQGDRYSNENILASTAALWEATVHLQGLLLRCQARRLTCCLLLLSPHPLPSQAGPRVRARGDGSGPARQPAAGE